MSEPLIPYVGRFAPSPSGPLHFGSLVAALGSYLQARHQQGRWLVRIEDLDPPREVAGAADGILRTLERFGLQWDGEIGYQSRRHERYQQILDELHQQGLTYHCHCSRARIQSIGGLYDGHCRALALTARDSAVRVRLDTPVYGFNDALLGPVRVDVALAAEDFILKRRDGLYAYNLAVVIDDGDSGITQVVRGADLLEPTARQIALYRLLGWREPTWLHLPLAIQCGGLKLSKQNHAPALPLGKENELLWLALNFLGQAPDPALRHASTTELLAWAIGHWRCATIPTQAREVEQ